jgi:hypothetical protein
MSAGNDKLTFLGLGSMVDVDDMDALADTKYVVIARAVGKNSAGGVILRYRLAPHPSGITPSNDDDILTVEGSKITHVYTKGYVDAKDDVFLSNKLQELTGSKVNAKALTQPKPSNSNIAEETTASTNAQTNRNAQVSLGASVPETVVQQAEEKADEKLKTDPFYKFRKKGDK